MGGRKRHEMIYLKMSNTIGNVQYAIFFLSSVVEPCFNFLYIEIFSLILVDMSTIIILK